MLFMTTYKSITYCVMNSQDLGLVAHVICSCLKVQEWSCMVDKGEGYNILYLDYSKAFDTVPHERLIKRLEAVDITGKILNWIDNFLHCRQQRVVANGVCSSWPHA